MAMTVDYPYINYGVANRQQTNGEEWQQTARLASLERFEPQNLRYFSDHLVDVYEEAATIARPPLQPACRRPLSNKTGYIVCVYKVFDGDDGEKFERNWLYWTGKNCILLKLRRYNNFSSTIENVDIFNQTKWKSWWLMTRSARQI